MPRVERQARNRALFREVNERISEVSSGFDVTPTKQPFFCECSHMGCTETVSLSAEEYADVRDHQSTFFVAFGHEDPDRERVLVRMQNYLIVSFEPVDAAKQPTDTVRA